MVPGISDDEQDVAGLANYLSELNSRAPGLIERVEILPFHKMGENKWVDLGMKYELTDTRPPSQEMVERVRAQFSAKGLFCC
ncbi:hypothetical protein [Deefgea sp. CFH1-16]|uniref:hypothetical protein n=1 Tax=Deefgea sp. CFH1-16 TaxID=2675457 RepID=UPI001FFDEB68|nr:hypothetical protein [Deefgea sp. CFH1-16]